MQTHVKAQAAAKLDMYIGSRPRLVDRVEIQFLSRVIVAPGMVNVALWSVGERGVKPIWLAWALDEAESHHAFKNVVRISFGSSTTRRSRKGGGFIR